VTDETKEERTLPFLCECDDLACDERVALTSVDYEWLVIERPGLALASRHWPGLAARHDGNGRAHNGWNGSRRDRWSDGNG
jgi:hypothetical protein